MKIVFGLEPAELISKPHMTEMKNQPSCITDGNIVGRGFLTPYFMKTPYFAYLHFLKFFPTPPALFVALFLWLNV